MSPLITVLMPVYNGEKYLKEAVESILNQTFRDFEFLIINDGSTDNSVGIIQSFNDSRLRLIHNESNLGLIKTLNKGFKLSRGKYIARMDCDDISLPKRLSAQASFMEKHQGIGVCGSWVKVIGLGEKFINKYPLKHEEARAYLLFNTPFAHPSVIIRKEVIEKYNLEYDEDYKHAEDYELWSRIIEHTKISNIPKVLLHYRAHPESASKKNSSIQTENSNRIRLKLLKQLSINPTPTELDIHRRFIRPDYLNPKDFISQLEIWFSELLSANEEMMIYEQNSLTKVISSRWLNSCATNTSLGFWILKKFWQSPLKKINYDNFGQVVKFFIKCLIRKNKN